MNKFRNSSNTRFTRALFFEETLEDKSTVVYTLKDVDHMGYPSLYRLYMEEADLTEYTFANKHLDGWGHWEMLTGSAWFRPFVSRWRKELELSLKAKALRRIQSLAEGSTKDSFSANKFILSYGQSSGTKGRPTKEDIKKAAFEELSVSKKVQQDFDRLVSPPLSRILS